MDPASLWLLAGCATVTGLALWKPSTPSRWQSQRVVLLALLIFALVSEGGHALARRLGHPEHAELGIWSYAANAFLCFLGALRYPFDIPGTRGAHVSRRARRALRLALAAAGFAFLGLGVHRDRRIVALYRRCEARYAGAQTTPARKAAAAQTLDPTLKEDQPSAHNPGPALKCRDITEP